MGSRIDAREALEIERAILRDLAFAVPVTQVLERICTLVEGAVPGAMCSVMLLDAEGALRICAAPSLGRDLWPRIDGLVPGPARGSCGRAAFTGTPVIVEDTLTDPVWADLRPLAAELGIRGCWSHPICAGGEVLGTFGISHPAPRAPGEAEQELLVTASHLAVVAIESDRARRAQHLLERQMHHSQKLEAIGQRAGEVAHDLGNLVTVILGGTDALRGADGCADPAAVRVLAIDQIRGAGRRAAEIIRQLLRLGRPSPRPPQWIDPVASLAEIEAMLRRFVHERIRWRVVPLGRPHEIAADPAEFQRLVTNLVVNAAEAMPAGGDLTISFAVARAPDGSPRIVIEVRDTGCGIAPESRPRIFEPFFTTKSAEKGTGLGLSSVRSTVERLGGSIEFESEPGVGTVFRVTLPARERATTGGATTVASAAPAASAPSAASGAHGRERSRGRVLLCEDDALVRSLLSETMRAAGYTVFEARHGAEAMECAARGRVDLLVCDVVMPGVDGPTLLARLRAGQPELPCIFISGYPRDVIERSFARRGVAGAGAEAAEYLEKPFSPAELLARVEKTLSSQEEAIRRQPSAIGRTKQRSDLGTPKPDRCS